MQIVNSRTRAGGLRAPARLSPPAYTLLELLAAMGVIALLSALGLGAVTALRARSDLHQCRAELAVLAGAIESFRRYHGSYPQTLDPVELYAALIGWRGPRNEILTARGRRFLSSEGLSLAAEDPDAISNVVLDPWGRPYGYGYSPGEDWQVPGFLLYSAGPDGETGPHEHGLRVPASAADADNVYAFE